MLIKSEQIKAFIIDLDDTLYDCSNTLVVRGRRRVAKTIAGLINCTEEKAYLLQQELEEKYGTKANIYEKLALLHGLPQACAKELLEEFVRVEISNIALFPDVTDTLQKLKSQGYKLFLVTSGEDRIQTQKIELLGLHGGYFDEMMITDRELGHTKRSCFKQIMQKHTLKPEEIVCVGDKCDDELLTGKTLGMITVMFEHGRHYKAYLKETHKQVKPDYSIKHFHELLSNT
jgi:putative hydrolase of the HAD superfamily